MAVTYLWWAVRFLQFLQYLLLIAVRCISVVLRLSLFQLHTGFSVNENRWECRPNGFPPVRDGMVDYLGGWSVGFETDRPNGAGGPSTFPGGTSSSTRSKGKGKRHVRDEGRCRPSSLVV